MSEPNVTGTPRRIDDRLLSWADIGCGISAVRLDTRADTCPTTCLASYQGL